MTKEQALELLSSKEAIKNNKVLLQKAISVLAGSIKPVSEN